ncbi:MAG TPA: ribosome biogenesis GTP-binding protein YihA/YsxC [Buchnera sp. (in: enterobacteria)]|nr:ribosome biogenesis GTP-binding protein YihA/YsxC [Buchnera sp. (in: enterobacteria)]
MILIKHNYYKTYFIKSEKIITLPIDLNISEVAFVGYSNAGKSSAINTLTNQKKLARISKTPGRTQLINFFAVSQKSYLVDLPGYGYARVPKSLTHEWQTVIFQYLITRYCLKGIVLFMDIRHLIKKLDYDVIQIANKNKLPLLILLTKSDKLTWRLQQKQLKYVHQQLSHMTLELLRIGVFSSLKKTGIQLLYKTLNYWYSL